MNPEDQKMKIVPVPMGSKNLRRGDEYIQVPVSSSGEEELDPYVYLQVIWKHRKIGLLFLAAVLVSALLVSLLTKPMYKASSTVEVALQKPQVVEFKEVENVNISDPEFFNTQRDLIQSRAMAEAVISKFDLWDHPDFKKSQINLNPFSILFSYLDGAIQFVEDSFDKITSDGEGGSGKSDDIAEQIDWEKVKRDRVIQKFLSRLEVTPAQDSRIINITFEAYSPSFAAKMANAVADTFVEWSLDRSLEANREARKFLKAQLDDVEKNLAQAEEKLHEYKKENNIVGLDKDMNLIYRQLEELNTALANASSETTSNKALYKSVKSGNPSANSKVIDDPTIRQLRQRYNELMVEYNDLSSYYKSEYPPLKQLEAKISAVSSRMKDEIDKKVTAIQSDYESAEQKEELLKERVEEQEKLAMSLNEKTIKYRNLEREVESTKSIYESLLERMKETDVTGGLKSSAIQVVDHAFIPTTPFMPNTARNLVLAFIVGLIGAVGIAFLREFFDRTIKTAEEVRDKLHLPVLGSIMDFDKIESGVGNKNGSLNIPAEKLYLSSGPRSAFSEAIRNVAASIRLSSQNGLCSILITSPWPGEGKTTLAGNLALSLSFGSNRVLLVDSDLRHPSVGRSFGIDDTKPGISNFLNLKSDLDEIIHSTEIPQLSVLPTGSAIPANPSEVLQSQRMKQLLEELKDRFDYIILDSSPAIGISDSLMLSTMVDATLLVASVGITMPKDISYVAARLSDVDAKFLGVVINRVEIGRDAYYYHNYYGNYDVEQFENESLGGTSSRT